MDQVCLCYEIEEQLLESIRTRVAHSAVLRAERHPSPETTILVSGHVPENLSDLTQLHTWIVPFAGVPGSVRAAADSLTGVRLYNLHHNAAATAEMAVGLLIAAARRLAESDRLLRTGFWRGRQDNSKAVLLAGKRAAIFGYGAIGRNVAVILQALGMQTVGIRRQSAEEPGVVGQDSFEAVLETCHALIVTAPSTVETRGAIRKRHLELLLQPRLFVNVGRGDIVNEQELFECCRDGTLAGAGIDVWYRYPKPEDDGPIFPSEFAFHELQNIVMSPHRGGDGDDSESLRALGVAELLHRLLDHRHVRPVQLDLGY